MKRIIIFLIVASFALCLHAEEFVIEQDFYEALNDASGSDANNPKDANGVETAIIKVQCTLNDLVFVSDYIIGEQQYYQGQYVFFMAEGARFLEIRKKDGTYLPITIKFADYGVKKVKRKCCYKMVMSGKDVKYYGRLIINYGPQGAVLKINDEPFYGGSTYDKLLEVNQYSISVEKNGFGTYNEIINLNRDDTIKRTIVLSQSSAFLTIETDELSDIYVDGIFAGKHKYVASVSIGNHRVKVKHGEIEEEHKINVSSSGATFKKEILGCLRESYAKSNQKFMAGYDFLKPRRKNNMEERTIYSETTNSLLGDYKVVFTRPGYWSRSKNVHVEQVQTTEVNAPNLYKKKPWTFLSFQYSPKADAGLMLGICGIAGGYISGRCNIGMPLFSGNMHPAASENTFGVNSWSVNGGLMFRLCQELYLYAGAGYGTFESDGSKFKYSPKVRGANVEGGVIVNIHGKSGKGFTITAGYNTLVAKEYFSVMDPLSNIVVGIGCAL